ncbi:MAG: PAS domain-containing protein [Acetobacteraceae bacterium]|nr:PAS domain-containing protein [Acetobacteraceae bacterium]
MIAQVAERGLLLNGLLAAMRLSGEPMVISDPHQPDNPIIAVNRAFEQLTQYPESELSGRNCRFLQGPETDRETVRQLGDCLRRGDGCVQFLNNYRRDGSSFINLLFISPVCGHDGRLHFFFASQHDLCADTLPTPAEFPIGAAHMAPGQQTEFRLLLLDIAQEVATARTADALPTRVRALEAALAGAREVAAMATKLRPGRLKH